MKHKQPRVCFFAGPSITPREIQQACAGLDAEVRVLPPIQQGDLLRMSHDLPGVLGIIDGYFYQVPAVLHKEILLALENGSRVLGAASLGALRAAELQPYGMEGVGEVFRLYETGEIDGDDEVAVAHGGAADGYRSLTEPLVNIRHHVRSAREQGLICDRTAAALLAAARRLHFAERTYAAVLDAAAGRLTSPAELAGFRRFLQQGAVDLKREDALRLVHTVANRLRGTLAWPPGVPFRLNRTKYLRIMQRDYVGRFVDQRHIPDTAVLSFHRLLSHSFRDLFQRVGLRCLAVDEAQHRGMVIKDRAGLLRSFRAHHGLTCDAKYDEWLRARCLAEEELLDSLRERELERRLLALYRKRFPAGRNQAGVHDCLVADLAARTGLGYQELVEPPFMQPGIVWEGPMIREMKLSGAFSRALEQAGRILEFEHTLLGGNPQLRVAFDSLIHHAYDRLESWLCDRWGIPLDELDRALRQRGVVRYREFLEVARLVYLYETHLSS